MSIRGQPEFGPKTPNLIFGVSGLAAGDYAKNQSMAFGASGLMSEDYGKNQSITDLPHDRRS